MLALIAVFTMNDLVLASSNLIFVIASSNPFLGGLATRSSMRHKSSVIDELSYPKLF